jgi:hypothetical protein
MITSSSIPGTLRRNTIYRIASNRVPLIYSFFVIGVSDHTKEPVLVSPSNGGYINIGASTTTACEGILLLLREASDRGHFHNPLFVGA